MDPAYTYYTQADSYNGVRDEKLESRFPVLLHKIINSGTYRDSIVWLGHGRAFAITDLKKFVTQVIPRFFCSYEWNTFLTWMCAYGFKEICGFEEESNEWKPDLLIFYHEVSTLLLYDSMMYANILLLGFVHSFYLAS